MQIYRSNDGFTGAKNKEDMETKKEGKIAKVAGNPLPWLQNWDNAAPANVCDMKQNKTKLFHCHIFFTHGVNV